MILDMPKTVPLSTPMKERIVEAVREGESCRTVAKRFKVSKSVVSKLSQHMKAENSVKRHKPTGRPRKLTKQTLRRLRRAVLAEPTSTSKALASDICPEMSRRTVRHVLNRSGLVARRPAKKPAISRKNRLARIAFAKAHRNWTLAEWSSVIWSDECRFRLKNADSIQFVRRPPNTRYEAKYTAPTVKHGGGGIMLWGKTSCSCPDNGEL